MRFYYKSNDDIKLLTLVQRLKPFLSTYGETNNAWSELAKHFNEDGRSITGKGCRDRFFSSNCIIQIWWTDETKKTGTDEEFELKKKLLTDISMLMESKNTDKESKNKKLIQKKRKLSNFKENALNKL